jgi:hypothetical protein
LLAALPGEVGAVAAAVGNRGDGIIEEIKIFGGAIRGSFVAPAMDSIRFVGSGAPHRLLVAGHESLFTLRWDGDELAVDSRRDVPRYCFHQGLAVEDDVVVGAGGCLVRLEGDSGLVRLETRGPVSVADGKVYMIGRASFDDPFELLVFDEGGRPTARVYVRLPLHQYQGAAETPGSLVRWGPRGLAFIADGRTPSIAVVEHDAIGD